MYIYIHVLQCVAAFTGLFKLPGNHVFSENEMLRFMGSTATSSSYLSDTNISTLLCYFLTIQLNSFNLNHKGSTVLRILGYNFILTTSFLQVHSYN